jgi:hypothetical protein
VAHEGRLRTRQAVIAGLAGICLLVGAVLQSVGQPKVQELTVELLSINRHVAQEVAGGVVNALGLLGLALTLSFLFTAARARRPESAPVTRIVALVGGVVGAIGGTADAIFLAIKAHQFAMNGTQSYLDGDRLVNNAATAVLQYAGLIGSLLLAMAFVLVSMNAMRVGLLTKFLGYLGMVAAAASLFLLGSPIGLVIQVFWLLAVAYLLAGRWPGGDPRAWVTGQAEPWPTAAEVREQRDRARGKSAPAGRAAGRAPARQPQPAAPKVQTRSTTPKRKRKRRK